MSSVGKWMDLEIIILHEISPIRKKNTIHFLSYVESRTKRMDINIKGGLFGNEPLEGGGEEKRMGAEYY
jgi:hypothetical protein